MPGGREAEESTRPAGGLPQKNLVSLVARQACEGRVSAARLHAAAGKLQAPTPEEPRTVRNLINEAAAILDSAYEWDLHDIYRAGLDLVRELHDHALEQGRPIATGVVEGTAGHLAGDRLKITGAWWGLAGAEAILNLRAVTGNGDLDSCWAFPIDRGQHRLGRARHQETYAVTA